MDKTLKKKQNFESEDFEEPKKEEISEPKISFNAWFSSKASSKELKPWQYKEVLVFFEQNGLSLDETREAFDQCFSKF